MQDVPDGEAYLGVRGRGAGGEPDADRSFGEPVRLLDLFAGVEGGAGRLVADGVAVYAVAAGYVLALRDPLLGDDCEVVSVRRVVAADDDHDVERLLQ